MFGKRQKELEFYQAAIENMEASKKSCELMVNAIDKLMNQKLAPMAEHVEIALASDAEWSDEEKKQAAYALNLCTVSVSQIIDYDDENILEQEYETILNNLNLENMPKDEALLNILKQILDTVTFFRIQEGDKALLDKEYQQKMKNAIWSSVPNFGLIIATGNPFAMAASLASQVGIGYMNYRKQKAEIGLAKEKSEWQLQRAAIEQLNALRRELFDASWRLADRYGFSDEYRLTEKQISQYNRILMDPDDVKRYERLDAIKNKFVAYPAFWYHFGHAANCIAQSARCDDELDHVVYATYKSKALEYFGKFMNSDKHSLLRDDPITSSCALEYIDLLGDSEEDKKIIKELLIKAIKACGGACDIMQLCAVAYLRIGEFSEARSLLKYLVNENYNTQMNAQLLSGLYVRELMTKASNEFKVDYRILEKKKNVCSAWLFPIPTENESMETLTKRFMTIQKERLSSKFKYVMERYCEKSEARFNKCVPVPDENLEYKESFFSGIGDYRFERLGLYENCLRNEGKRADFLARLTESNFTLKYIDVMNETLNGFERLWPEGCNMVSLADKVKDGIEKNKSALNKMQFGVTDNYDYCQLLSDMDTYGFKFFMAESMSAYFHCIISEISKMDNMVEFTKREVALSEFCKIEGIEEYVERLGNEDDFETSDGDANYLSYDILGGDAKERADYMAKLQRMSKLMEEWKSKIVMDHKEKPFIFIKQKGNDANSEFRKYFTKHRFEWYKDKDSRQEVFAVMLSSSNFVPDIAFTARGIRCIWYASEWFRGSTLASYEEITRQDNKLIIGKEKYTNKNANIAELYQLIQEYAEKFSTDMSRVQNTSSIEDQSCMYDLTRQIDCVDRSKMDIIDVTYASFDGTDGEE